MEISEFGFATEDTGVNERSLTHRALKISRSGRARTMAFIQDGYILLSLSIRALAGHLLT